MPSPSSLLLPLLALLVTPATAQAVLHCKFDEGCGAEIVNFAPAPTVGNGALITTAPGGIDAARTDGRFGEAISGSSTALGNTRVDTGFAPGTIVGSFSFAMWVRNNPANVPSIPFGYLFGATGGNLRLFTGSSGRMFLSGVPGSATSATNLTAQLNAGWVHIACTIDATAQLATWYVNGVADPAVSLTQPVALAGTDFAIGARSTTGGSHSPLDIDEFLLEPTVWTPTDVLVLSLLPRAGDGSYTSGVTTQCGAGNVTLGSVNGPPSIGNLGYGLEIASVAPAAFALWAGFDRCNLGGSVPLPLDGNLIGPPVSGCWILADAPFFGVGAVAGASVVVPFPIPATLLGGETVYTQVLTIDGSTGLSSMSNGFATSAGS